jgi:hypothetical protein
MSAGRQGRRDDFDRHEFAQDLSQKSCRAVGGERGVQFHDHLAEVAKNAQGVVAVAGDLPAPKVAQRFGCLPHRQAGKLDLDPGAARSAVGAVWPGQWPEPVGGNLVADCAIHLPAPLLPSAT